MNEFLRNMKNLLILIWCVWVLVLTFIGLFTVDSFEEAFIMCIVALFAFAIPAHWLEP